jgi:gamma-carbonic anhydrase
MLIEHEGRSPDVDPAAWVAPTAVLCGDVRVAAGARVLWNAVLVDDGGTVELGEQAIVMERVVHVNSAVPDDGLVPIGWVAVGDPAEILPPDRHDDIWDIQRELDFPGTVLGVARETSAADITRGYAELFGRHRDDQVID